MESYQIICVIITVLLFIINIVGQWVVFTKAGYNGWAAVIPIYHDIVLLKVAKLSLWWLLWCLVPLGGIIVLSVKVCLDIAEAFGKPASFGIGLLLLPFIFFPILAFGKAVYLRECEEEYDEYGEYDESEEE